MTSMGAPKQAEDLEGGKCSEVHRQKLARLLHRRQPKRETFKAVHNISSRDLSDNISLLSQGLNFAIAPRRVPKRDIIAEVEEKLRHFQDTTGVNLARSRIVSVLANAKSPSTTLDAGERAAPKDLKSDNSIIILSAGKGKGTVALDRREYEQKIRQDGNNDGSECSAFAEERRAAGGNPLRGRSRQRVPAGKKPRAKNNPAIGPGEATRTLHQQRRHGLTTRVGRHLRRLRGSKRHRLKR
ncbi:hypothetical protein HPB50_005788 [Hyalomma asiaticum]|uniref:Uncharacterized protein n=1 Tax=Hyalomma asiaticum TaxID=266040 RepID=A0ACB7SVK0_HYAAI|nr:hypothetical protein HPB50_005788 [Hyalomma asiaticum]